MKEYRIWLTEREQEAKAGARRAEDKLCDLPAAISEAFRRCYEESLAVHQAEARLIDEALKKFDAVEQPQ